jgi:putative flippase GtrA
MRNFVAQLGRFGVVGLVGFGVDLGVFNTLRLTLLDPHQVQHGSFWAKVISTSLAIIVNWLGNRYWTFRHLRRPHWVREAIEFALVSLGGLLISLGCLWVSQYVFHQTSLLADNIATNGFGLVLGTLFRFTFYRLWVFRGQKGELPETGSIAVVDGDGLADSPASRLV